MSTTVKFGAGYDVPWFVAEGTVEEQRQQIIDAFKLKVAPEVSLAEVAVQASLHAHALVNASTVGKQPAKKAAPAQGEGTQKESIADKAKNATPAQDKPAAKKAPAKRASSKDPILEAIKAAGDQEALRKVHADNKDNWTPAYTDAAGKRAKELKEAA